jgi:hypothetical protein
VNAVDSTINNLDPSITTNLHHQNENHHILIREPASPRNPI